MKIVGHVQRNAAIGTDTHGHCLLDKSHFPLIWFEFLKFFAQRLRTLFAEGASSFVQLTLQNN